MLQKRENNTGKIFARSPKPFGHKHLPLSIVDIMLSDPHRLFTVLSLRIALHDKKKYWYGHRAIESCINCIADMQHVALNIHTVKRGRNTKTKAFSITIKTANNEVGQTLFG